MKKVFFPTLVFLTWAAGALSQIQFPKTDAIWKEEHIFIGGPYLTHFALCGDTVINGTSYSKVVSLQVDSNLQVTEKGYMGGFRQEGQKSFYSSSGFPNEIILYDFTLEAGNTIDLYMHHGSTEGLTRTVDSTTNEMIAGKMRKVIYFQPDWEGCPKEWWIEGIGSNFGFLGRGFSDCYASDFGSSLQCFQHQDEYYTLLPIECFLPELTGCNLTNSSRFAPKGESLKLTVSPNPSSSRLKFFINKNEGLNSSNLKIYAANGKILKVVEQVGMETPLPSDLKLSPGFYIAVLGDKETDRVMAHTTFIVKGE